MNKVDKWFPSNKTCSICGAIRNELSLSERVFDCGCGNIIDRDEGINNNHIVHIK